MGSSNHKTIIWGPLPVYNHRCNSVSHLFAFSFWLRPQRICQPDIFFSWLELSSVIVCNKLYFRCDTNFRWPKMAQDRLCLHIGGLSQTCLLGNLTVCLTAAVTHLPASVPCIWSDFRIEMRTLHEPVGNVRQDISDNRFNTQILC